MAKETAHGYKAAADVIEEVMKRWLNIQEIRDSVFASLPIRYSWANAVMATKASVGFFVFTFSLQV